MSVDEKRSVWIPEWETDVITAKGQDWPEGVIVNKWERNLLGEKRYVDSKWYYASLPQIINLGENVSPEDVKRFRQAWNKE